MHYRNGRPAKNGDEIVSLESGAIRHGEAWRGKDFNDDKLGSHSKVYR